MIAASPYRYFQTQRNGIREGQFHLAVVTARTEDPQVRNHAVPWADDRDRFLGCKEAILVKCLERREPMPLAEEPFQIFLRHMAMASRDVHDQFRCTRLAVGRSPLSRS